MTRDEVRERLQFGDYGPNYFCGIDEVMQNIVEQRDVDGLLKYGIDQSPTVSLLKAPATENSAFVQLEEELRLGEAEEIKASLERALNHW